MKNRILLLHGALGSSGQFERLKETLEEHLVVDVMNFAGHGKVPFSGNFSIDGFTEETADYLRSKAIQKIDVFGYSMGGYVGVNLSLRFPELVSRLITLGTKFDWTPEIASKEVKLLNTEKMREKVPRFVSYLEDMHGADNLGHLLEKTAKMMTSLGQGAGIASEDLDHIDQDITICVGDQDHMVSIKESEEVARSLKNGRLKILEGFVHPIEKVDSQKLSEVILQICARE